MNTYIKQLKTNLFTNNKEKLIAYAIHLKCVGIDFLYACILALLFYPISNFLYLESISNLSEAKITEYYYWFIFQIICVFYAMLIAAKHVYNKGFIHDLFFRFGIKSLSKSINEEAELSRFRINLRIKGQCDTRLVMINLYFKYITQKYSFPYVFHNHMKINHSHIEFNNSSDEVLTIINKEIKKRNIKINYSEFKEFKQLIEKEHPKEKELISEVNRELVKINTLSF